MFNPDFQDEVGAWCIGCFGLTTAADVSERNWRFLEEALELVQSLGADRDRAHELVDYVFDREIGDPYQEVGGTMVTLAALTYASNLPMFEAGQSELDRVRSPEIMEKIRKKNETKPRDSSLPGLAE